MLDIRCSADVAHAYFCVDDEFVGNISSTVSFQQKLIDEVQFP
jgi:hypothetical protein